MKICPKCSELYQDASAFCTQDGASLVKATDPLLGRTIAARYRLIRRLGVGGMSSVYLARHVIIERLSAIKVLRQDLGLNPASRERFLREARAVNRINHPNIVEITDYGEADGIAYLVMEYVEGESLLAHLKRGGMAWPRAATVAMQVASALGRAHQTGVIHRDLKPENVILVATSNGLPDRVKLTDFGIAKIVDAPALTFSEQIFGTPGYIAPEYVEGIPADGRADLYALGVVLYEMVTGSLPYEARTQADLLLMPLNHSPIPPNTRVAGLPPELERLMLQLLARRAEDRPRDAFAVVDALVDVVRRYANPSVKPPPVTGSSGDIVMIPAGDPRRSSPTLMDVAATEEPQPSGKLTANVARYPTSEMSSRWSTMLMELEAQIQTRAKEKGSSGTFATDRASELAGVAREMIPRLEKASRTVADHQSRVDRLEAEGRDFRANLGHAIDELARDRSRERAHLEAVRGRAAGMDAAAESAPPDSLDARVWEKAAMVAELERAEGIDRDLSFQIEALQKQLDLQNETFERQMMESAGALEGSLSAVRRLTSELVRTLDEAAAVLSGERGAA